MEKIPRWKKWKIKNRLYMDCIVCKNGFDYPKNSKGRKYCSRSCQWKSLVGKKASDETKKKMSISKYTSVKYRESLKTRSHPVNSGQFKIGSGGDRHYNWKGGITTINEKIRKSLEYESWRKSVFERDLYTCQHCSEIGGKLEADHIKPFSTHPKLRLDLSNGRTLCHDCHIKTDTWGAKVRWRRKNG